MNIINIICGKNKYKLELWKLLSKSEMIRLYITHNSDKDNDLIVDLSDFDEEAIEHVYNYFNLSLYTFPTKLRGEIYKIADYLMIEDLKIASREKVNIFTINDDLYVEDLRSTDFNGILEGDIIMRQEKPYAIYYRKRFLIVAIRNNNLYIPRVMESEICRKFLPSIWQITNYKIYIPIDFVSYQTELYLQIEPPSSGSKLEKDVNVVLDLEHRKISIFYPKGKSSREIFMHMDTLQIYYVYMANDLQYSSE